MRLITALALFIPVIATAMSARSWRWIHDLLALGVPLRRINVLINLALVFLLRLLLRCIGTFACTFTFALTLLTLHVTKLHIHVTTLLTFHVHVTKFHRSIAHVLLLTLLWKMSIAIKILSLIILRLISLDGFNSLING